jgi:hypothetical protein
MKKDDNAFGHSSVPSGFRPAETVGAKRVSAVRTLFTGTGDVEDDSDGGEPAEMAAPGAAISEKDEIFVLCHPHISRLAWETRTHRDHTLLASTSGSIGSRRSRR